LVSEQTQQVSRDVRRRKRGHFALIVGRSDFDDVHADARCTRPSPRTIWNACAVVSPPGTGIPVPGGLIDEHPDRHPHVDRDSLGVDTPWIHAQGPQAALQRIVERVGTRPAYLTFDIDCLDLACRLAGAPRTL
jgi:hypothetical protein